MDIIIAQLPSKTIEIAPLGSSMLIGALRQKKYSAKQYDLNVILKNEFLKSTNLYSLYNKIWICVNILDTKIRTYLSCIQSLKFYLIRSIIIKS